MESKLLSRVFYNFLIKYYNVTKLVSAYYITRNFAKLLVKILNIKITVLKEIDILLK